MKHAVLNHLYHPDGQRPPAIYLMDGQWQAPDGMRYHEKSRCLKYTAVWAKRRGFLDRNRKGV